MSSRGQVVIPEDIRKRLRLKAGSQFIVIGEDDIVVLKTITSPVMSQFDSLITKARSQAKKAGLKQADIAAAVSRARNRG
jgi:AbrB family looped-hinge helix DNA binding protein